MKRIVVFAGLFASALFAAPVGNPAAPQLIEEGFFIPRDSWIDARAGYEGDFVSDERMEQYKEGSGRVDTYQQDTNAGVAVLNLLDRVDIFGIFGSSRTRADWRFLTAEGVIHRVEMETLYQFLWGVGARAILFEWGNMVFGIDGRYSFSNYKPAWLTIDGINDSVSGARCRWREWQVGSDFSYNIELFTLYLGLKYSNAQTRLGSFEVPISADGSGTNHFRNRMPVGIYFGCSLSRGRYFMLNIEGRLVDEEALTISGDLRF